MKINVLVLCPPFSNKGGVAHYCSLLNKHFDSERVSIKFYHTGKDYSKSKSQNRVIKSLFDLLSVIKIIPLSDLIVLNPSMDPKAVIRDGVFHFVAKRIFQRNTLVFLTDGITNLSG